MERDDGVKELRDTIIMKWKIIYPECEGPLFALLGNEGDSM